MAARLSSPGSTEPSLIKLLLILALLATERGPWLLIGRIPDRNPYTCSESSSGTYVGPAASITDGSCAVWNLGSGTTPNIVILRNGSSDNGGFGSQILYYLGSVYVKGSDANWYLYDNVLGYFQFYSSTDPSMAVTPVGYFVSTAGSDSNSCVAAQTASTPKRNFSGVNGALACLSAGATLFARSGTYAENITSVPSGTSWSNKVRVTNYPGETVTLKPTTGSGGGFVIWLAATHQYIEFDGINLDGTSSDQVGLWVSSNNTGDNPHHIRIQNADCYAGANGSGGCIEFGAHTVRGSVGSNEAINMTIHGGGVAGGCGFACASYGVYLAGPNNLVDGCDIYDVSGFGIQIYNAAGDAAIGNTIRNTKIHDITRYGDFDQVGGITVYGTGVNYVYNNVIYGIATGSTAADTGNAGISINGASTGVRIFNNTVYNNIAKGIYLGTYPSNTTGDFVQNNIIYLSGVANYEQSGTGHTVSNNLVGTNPDFVSAGSGNFRLLSSSLARDTGTSLASTFTTDLEGIPRPQGPLWDIGAYEYH